MNVYQTLLDMKKQDTKVTEVTEVTEVTSSITPKFKRENRVTTESGSRVTEVSERVTSVALAEEMKCYSTSCPNLTRSLDCRKTGRAITVAFWVEGSCPNGFWKKGDWGVSIFCPGRPCRICGAQDWWRRCDGSRWICRSCHPPAADYDIITA